MTIKTEERQFLTRAFELARLAEAGGNLPVAAVIVLDNQIVAEGTNGIFTPAYSPLDHAETVALRRLRAEHFMRASDLTVISTWEPCVMCASTMVLAGVGRLVFAAGDKRLGGGQLIRGQLSQIYTHRRLPEWIGPVDTENGQPLADRAMEIFHSGRYPSHMPK